MSMLPVEGGADLSTEQDPGFSLGSISRRDGGTMLTPEERVEAEDVARKIATFAERKGLNFAAQIGTPDPGGEGKTTTFLLGERRVGRGGRAKFELVVNISDKATYKTTDGPTTVSAELSIGPSGVPFLYVTEGAGSYGFEPKPSQLRAILRSLDRGAVGNRDGSSSNPHTPSWRSRAIK